MEIIIGILFAVSLFGNVFQHQKVETLQTQVEAVTARAVTAEAKANSNAAEAADLAKVARQNDDLVKNLKSSVSECRATLDEFEAVAVDYDDRREQDAHDATAFAESVASSSLAGCGVPGWVVDEIAGSDNAAAGN